MRINLSVFNIGFFSVLSLAGFSKHQQHLSQTRGIRLLLLCSSKSSNFTKIKFNDNNFKTRQHRIPENQACSDKTLQRTTLTHTITTRLFRG